MDEEIESLERQRRSWCVQTASQVVLSMNEDADVPYKPADIISFARQIESYIIGEEDVRGH